MQVRYTKWLGPAVALFWAAAAFAGEPAAGTATVRRSIERAIPLLEKGSAGSAEQRTCFTCHNQALPILALSAARVRGFSVDEDNLKRQVRHTFEHLQRGQKNYRQGRGQGGQVITAGYALWALEAGGHPLDDVTAAVTEYLLQYQQKASHWRHPGNRPPSSGSDFTTTYVALRGLAAFGTGPQSDRIQARCETVSRWLEKAAPADTEDRVFRLLGLNHVGASEPIIAAAAEELIEQQRGDGGWAQTDQMKSDAYATGTVLSALLRTGRLTAAAPAAEKAVRFLIESQLDDGSWHVVSRAKPFQTYYESGFPHAKDQFISIAASSWAALALVESLGE